MSSANRPERMCSRRPSKNGASLLRWVTLRIAFSSAVAKLEAQGIRPSNNNKNGAERRLTEACDPVDAARGSF